MAIKEAAHGYNKDLEKKVQLFWKDNDIYKKTNELRETKPTYSFLDGPPYCSGKIHLGTAWNKVIKDSYLRYMGMSGYNIRKQAGWDTHGLPIEHKVEELLKIKSKQEIEEKYGINNFINQCKEFAIENKDLMTAQFENLGIWMNWDKPYVTYNNDYMESCWWTLKQAHRKDLLVQDKRVITWCPHCETVLAMAEIDYGDKEDPSIFIKFPLKDQTMEYPTYILIWTTTPWTIPANLGVSVNSKFEYAYVKVLNPESSTYEVYIMAEALISSVFSDVDYRILKTVNGSELEDIEYNHPLTEEVPLQSEFNHKIILGDHVTLEDGTGCVHTAPGHGPEDYEVGQKYGLPVFSPVGENGCFTDEAGKYEGQSIKQANNTIIHDLLTHDMLLKTDTINHRVGFCWRCKTPIMYIATKQWFISITKIKQQMLEQLDTVEWIPSWAGDSRFRDWIENARDWTISRQRYWGIPLPIWQCKECKDIKVIGSREELKELSHEPDLTGDFMHRPVVDDITIPCDCGKTMHRVPDVLDVWIDSGVAGWASLNYPIKNHDELNEMFPYDFITEGHDQTRGWFYSQLGLGVVSFDKVPYKKVLMHGFTLDENGKKMSKSLGNVVSPEEVIKEHSADILRFYLLWANKPWDDLKFNWNEVKNVAKTFNILWNVYVFSTTYMSIDNFDPTKCDENNLNFRKEDVWIISRINSLILNVGEDLKKLLFNKATRKINDFILEDLSRWYVRLIRGRTWVESDDPDKLGAYYTLYHVLKNLIMVLAPIAPYVTEEIYQNLVRGVETEALESVHMLDWTYDKDDIDEELEENMDYVRQIIDASAHARDVARHKLRWPVTSITVVSEDENIIRACESLEDIILEQANTKKVITSNVLENAISIVKPNMNILGPKLRGDLGIVKKHFENIEGDVVKLAIENSGSYTIDTGEKEIVLTSDEILFESELPENIVGTDFDNGSVYVDVEVTPEIYSEAMSRELIRRIQEMRKDLDLDVESNINVCVDCSSELENVIGDYISVIASEVRSNKIIFEDISSDEGYIKEWSIEEHNLKIMISEK